MIHAGQRWHANTGPVDLLDIVREVSPGVWLVRTETGLMVEMSEQYIRSSFELMSEGEAGERLRSRSPQRSL